MGLLLVSVMGCASVPTPPEHPEPATVVRLFDGQTGRPLTAAEVAQRGALADVVFIGETHSHQAGLAAAEDLFARVLGLAPESAALGLEFYERDQQVPLDDYLAGITDENTFRETVGKPAENDTHRPLIEAARGAGRPVWALNAPRRYVRLARTRGLDAFVALTDEQRRLVAIPDRLTTGRYADTFYELMSGMGGHGEADTDAGPSEMAVGFFRAQNVWDTTMSSSAVRALDAGARPLVIVVGRFHTDFGGGLLERLRVAAPGARVMTVSVVDTGGLELRDEDRGRADVVIYAGAPGG